MDLDGSISTEVAIISKKEDYDDIVTWGLADSNEGKPVPSWAFSVCGLIPKGAKNVDLAKDFLKYLIQPEVLNEYLKTGLGFYLFTVHTATADGRSFLDRQLLTSANFAVGTVLMFAGGLIMTGTLALLSTMLENLMNYPPLMTGLVTMPRAIGGFVAMFLVAPLITRVDNRLIILFGFLLTAISMWQMSCFSLQMGMAPVIVSGLVQGFGLGCTQVPLNIMALSTLPPHILTQGTAIRSVMRNLGGSIGISVLVSQLARNTQIVHARLVEPLRPDNPLAHPPFLPAPFSLSTPDGIAALNAEVTRQAAMVAYIDDFRWMMLIALGALPLLLLLRGGRESRRAMSTAPAGAGVDD